MLLFDPPGPAGGHPCEPAPRAAGGADAAWNRTTLCAFHHLRGVHAGVVRIHGRAPDDLIYELGGETYRSGDVRVA